MRIVISAAAGNIGRLVAEQVLHAGHEAVLLVRNPASLPATLAAHPRARVVPLDLRAVGRGSRRGPRRAGPVLAGPRHLRRTGRSGTALWGPRPCGRTSSRMSCSSPA